MVKHSSVCPRVNAIIRRFCNENGGYDVRMSDFYLSSQVHTIYSEGYRQQFKYLPIKMKKHTTPAVVIRICNICCSRNVINGVTSVTEEQQQSTRFPSTMRS